MYRARAMSHAPVGGPTPVLARRWGSGRGVQSSCLYFNNVDEARCPVRTLLHDVPRHELQIALDDFSAIYFANVPSLVECDSETVELYCCFDTYTLHRPGFDPIQLRGRLPSTKPLASHNLGNMRDCSNRMTANPFLPLSVWINPGPGHALLSGEVIFICTAHAHRVPTGPPDVVDEDDHAASETVDLFYVQLHRPHTPHDHLKPSRGDPEMESDAVSALESGSSSICGGSGFRLPCDSWHPCIHADLVYLSDDTMMVPITMITTLADTFPLVDYDPTLSQYEGRVYGEIRPPLLRTYFRV
jgi:hypothetical protein